MKLFYLLCLLGLPARGEEAASLRPHMGGPANPEVTLKTAVVGAVEYLELDFPSNGLPVVGNKNILKVEKSGERQLKITPLKKGTSSLQVKDMGGKVRRSLVYNVVTN